MISNIIKSLRHKLHPLRAQYESFLGKHFPKTLASMRYKNIYGKSIDWKHPKNIDEKINWLKFHSDTSSWSLLADKYRVRLAVADCGLEDILVPLYGKWDKAEDIDWESLPSQFVMKANHGSGDMLVCKDKNDLDYLYWTNQFHESLHSDFSSVNGEKHYSRIKPCIIAEQLLDASKQPIESSAPIDYKIWAFDGKPAYIWCCLNRTEQSTEVITYDTEWNAHPEFSVDTPHYILTEKRLPRPATLNRMLEVASILSKGHPQVRVDLYEIDGKVYFGELTFTSSLGVNYFYTEEFRLKLGQLVKLPTDQK